MQGNLHVQFFGGCVSERERGYPLDIAKQEVRSRVAGSGDAQVQRFLVDSTLIGPQWKNLCPTHDVRISPTVAVHADASLLI
jgi:hypothetical protein